MMGYPPALRSTGFVAPRAIARFGAAIHEARAAETPPTPAQAWERPYPAAPERRTVVRLWIPSTVLFLLLAPFAVLLAPLGYLAPPRFRLRPFAVVFTLGRLLMSLSGTLIHVDTPDALVVIRLF